MGLTTIIKMLLEDMTFKKSSADLKREFLLQKENAEKAFNSTQVTQTSFSVIDACKYLIEECIPQGKADLYCCIQTKYSRKTAILTPSGSYAKEIAILQNQKDNDVKIVKKAKQKLLKDTYFKIEEQRRNKALHETYTIVGYTDEKEYADKWGRSSTNPIANKSDDELTRIWETIQYRDKLDSLYTRIHGNAGNVKAELFSKMIKFGNPFLQNGKAPLLYKIMLWQSKKDICISREAAKILTEFESVMAVAAESPESLDLSKPRQLELIQRALNVKETLGLDFIPVLKNGTTWKSIEDMENAAHDEKLEYQGETIDLMNAFSMSKTY